MPRPSPIVVIEDDADERTALDRVLRASGFDVSTYSSAEEFLAAPRSSALCLLLDLQLDGMSGLDLLRWLKAEGSTLPVILITASDDAESFREAGQLGCVACLHKPFSGRALVSLFRRLAHERQRRPPAPH